MADDNLQTEAWPSSASFDDLAEALSDPQSKKDAIKQAGTIFAFTLKNDKGEEKSWFIDLKETGTVGKGLAPEGKKADGESSMNCNNGDTVVQ